MSIWPLKLLPVCGFMLYPWKWSQDFNQGKETAACKWYSLACLEQFVKKLRTKSIFVLILNICVNPFYSALIISLKLTAESGCKAAACCLLWHAFPSCFHTWDCQQGEEGNSVNATGPFISHGHTPYIFKQTKLNHIFFHQNNQTLIQIFHISKNHYYYLP